MSFNSNAITLQGNRLNLPSYEMQCFYAKPIEVQL